MKRLFIFKLLFVALMLLTVSGCNRDHSRELSFYLTNGIPIWAVNAVVPTNYISSNNTEGKSVALHGITEYDASRGPDQSRFIVVIEDAFFNSLVRNSYIQFSSKTNLGSEWVYSGRARALTVFENKDGFLERRRYPNFKRIWISVATDKSHDDQ